MRVISKIVSFVVLLSILIGVLPLGANAAGELVGDIDKDGEITVSDALRILRVCARLDQYDESEIGIYDVWSDGKVGIEDALGVLRSSVGLIGNFGRTGVELRFEPNEKAVECGVTNEMLERSILSTEGTQRVAKVMEKAARGEDITVVTIGGSITGGSNATTPEKCYANRVHSWWRENFPQSKVNFRNSGIGGTGSLFGVHRLERDVLSYKPDFLIVEFAVNDDGDEKTGNPESYENLIRRILSESPETAVVILFMTAKNYVDKQSVQRPIGEAYGVPMISYRDAILPEFESGRFTWDGIAPDTIHPNDQGHGIVAGLINSYLDGVKRVYEDYSRVIPAVPEQMLYTDRYMNAKLNWEGGELKPTSMGSWRTDNYSYYDYIGSWYYPGGNHVPMVFELECRNIMILYEADINENTAGRIKVNLDKNPAMYVDSYFENGWGNHVTIMSIYTSEQIGKHTLKITPMSGKFRIAAILTA